MVEETALTQIDNTGNDRDIDSKSAELVNKIAKTDNSEELESLYEQFTINNTKKNAFRIAQLECLLDKINQEATDRITKRPEQISNKEMLDYMNAIGNQIERSKKLVDGIKDINAVQINTTHNNLTINVGEEKIPTLNKDSRSKITALISSLIMENTTTGAANNVVDVNEEETKPPEQKDQKDAKNPDIETIANDDNFQGDD